MGDYRDHLRRLTLHDDAFVTALSAEENDVTSRSLDGRTAALVRVAATVSVEGPLASFQHAVTAALVAGASTDEIVATLEALTPVIGAARVVASAPKIALALGYDVESALE